MKKRSLVIAAFLITVLIGAAVFLLSRGSSQTSSVDISGGAPPSADQPVKHDTSRAEQVPNFVPFTPIKSAPEFATNPDDPNYDPVALVAANSMRGADLFKRERRNPEWAAAVEKRMATVLGDDYAKILPGHQFKIESECRSSTCAVKVTLPKDLTEAEFMVAQGIPQWASVGSTVEMDGSRTELKFDMTFGKERRNPASLDKVMAEERAGVKDRFVNNPPPATADPNVKAMFEIYGRQFASKPSGVE